MKRLIYIVLILIANFSVYAQDNELNKLTEIVKSLKTADNASREKIVKSLANDKLWTKMDEAKDPKAECTVGEVKTGRFGLNQILNKAENRNTGHASTGNMLNGADSRYNYSLFEKTLKANTTATFKLQGRWGEQIFVILPYNGAQQNITAAGNKGEFKSVKDKDGTIKLTGNAKKGEPLTITVTNHSDKNISYVILNYNSRK